MVLFCDCPIILLILLPIFLLVFKYGLISVKRNLALTHFDQDKADNFYS